MEKVLIGLVFPLLISFLSAGCATGPQAPPANDSIKTSVAEPITPPPASKKLVAISGFENRSAFSADRIWEVCVETLSARAIESGYFRVVEWVRMKQLFDWDVLSTSTLVKSPQGRLDVQRVLLCELFLSGAVTYFDVSQNSFVSAMSKQKEIETTVKVELVLQDAQTGEYLVSSDGTAVRKQIYRGNALRGQTGTWSPKTGDEALDEAIRIALVRLIRRYDSMTRGHQ